MRRNIPPRDAPTAIQTVEPLFLDWEEFWGEPVTVAEFEAAKLEVELHVLKIAELEAVKVEVGLGVITRMSLIMLG